MIIHYYAGSCADLFDADGVSLGVLPYANEDEFAQAAEKWMPVSEKEVREHCCIPDSMLHLLDSCGLLKDAQNGAYVLLHMRTGIFYFFVA